jgi:hypothetical protein
VLDESKEWNYHREVNRIASSPGGHPVVALPVRIVFGGLEMMRMIGVMLLLIGVSGLAMAVPAPEIDPSSAGSALALLSGALLVLRGRRKK